MPSSVDHSALTSNAVSCIHAGSVRRYRTNTWTRGAVKGHCSFTPLQVTLEIRCWTIQYRTIIEKKDFATDNQLKKNKHPYTDTTETATETEKLRIETEIETEKNITET